jgi:hypothetical protein
MFKKVCLLMGSVALCIIAAKAQPRPISDAEALDAGHRVEKTANSGDAYQIDNFLVPDSLLEKIREQSDALKNPAFLAGFSEGFIPTIKSYGEQIMAGIKGGNYRLLREYDDHGVKHLVFRMFGLGGLNYHDFKLIRLGDTVRASDLYPFTSEEWVSSSIAKVTDMMRNSSNMAENVRVLQKMTDQMNKKDYTGVRVSYEQLNKAYKDDRFIEYMYVRACHHIDIKLYQQVLEEYTANFPGAGGGYLLMLDLYALQKDTARGLAAIDKLDKLVGGDPFLDFFRGSFYSLSGNSAISLACYERVYRYDPAIAVNSLRLARRYAAGNKMDKAKEVIAGYKQTMSYHEGDLDDLYSAYPGLK